MRTEKKNANKKSNLQREVRQLLNKNELHHEGQLKERILWIHLKAIIQHLYGQGNDVKQTLNAYDAQWKLMEQSETYRLSVWEKGDPRLHKN